METKTLTIGDKRIREALGRIPSLYVSDLLFDLKPEIEAFWDENEDTVWNIVGLKYYPRHYSLEITFRLDPEELEGRELHEKKLVNYNFSHSLSDRHHLTIDQYENDFKHEIPEFIANLEKEKNYKNLKYERCYFDIDYFEFEMNVLLDFSFAI